MKLEYISLKIFVVTNYILALETTDGKGTKNNTEEGGHDYFWHWFFPRRRPTTTRRPSGMRFVWK